MTTEGTTNVPGLAGADIYIYAHSSGVLELYRADGRAGMVPLEEAFAALTSAHAAAGRVIVGGANAPLSLDALTRLGVHAGTLDFQMEPFTPLAPPSSWEHGTDALMEAAANGTDAILDDLIARGADVRRRDDKGMSALHQAAAAGNLHAIDALVRAGAEVDVESVDGYTPRLTAIGLHQAKAAALLRALGSKDPIVAPGPLVFGWVHRMVMYFWFATPALLLGLAVSGTASVLFLLVLLAALVVWVFALPRRVFWAGGAPSRLDGTVLTLRRVTGAAMTVELAGVTAAAISVSTNARYKSSQLLILAHPGGYQVDRRALRRLQVPKAEVDEFTARADRVVVVMLSTHKPEAVLLPVATLLADRGVWMSSSLVNQWVKARLVAARTTAS